MSEGVANHKHKMRAHVSINRKQEMRLKFTKSIQCVSQEECSEKIEGTEEEPVQKLTFLTLSNLSCQIKKIEACSAQRDN